MKPELQQQLQDALGLPDEVFDYHATDLYVLDLPGVATWLSNNYQFPESICSFIGAKESGWEGKRAFDIPFAGKWPERFLKDKNESN